MISCMTSILRLTIMRRPQQYQEPTIITILGRVTFSMTLSMMLTCIMKEPMIKRIGIIGKTTTMTHMILITMMKMVCMIGTTLEPTGHKKVDSMEMTMKTSILTFAILKTLIFTILMASIITQDQQMLLTRRDQDLVIFKHLIGPSSKQMRSKRGIEELSLRNLFMIRKNTRGRKRRSEKLRKSDRGNFMKKLRDKGLFMRKK